MATITCPKCGAENPVNAINCKSCRINLKFALEHLDEMEFALEHPDAFEPMDAPRPRCSACGSTNVAIQEVRKIHSGRLVGGLVMGLVFLVGAILMERPATWDPDLYTLVKIFGFFIGAWIIWDVLTGLPLPFVRIKLFKEEWITQAKCADCSHQRIFRRDMDKLKFS